MSGYQWYWRSQISHPCSQSAVPSAGRVITNARSLSPCRLFNITGGTGWKSLGQTVDLSPKAWDNRIFLAIIWQELNEFSLQLSSQKWISWEKVAIFKIVNICSDCLDDIYKFVYFLHWGKTMEVGQTRLPLNGHAQPLRGRRAVKMTLSFPSHYRQINLLNYQLITKWITDVRKHFWGISQLCSWNHDSCVWTVIYADLVFTKKHV